MLRLVLSLHLFLSKSIGTLAENFRSELELSWLGRASDLVTAFAWSPAGDSWAASSANGEALWNIGGGELDFLRQADGRSIDKIAFSADGRWLAAGGQAGKLWVWNCEDLQLPPQLVATIEIDRWIEQLVWHPTTAHLAISHDRHVKIWEAIADREIGNWQFDKSSVFDLSWHPAGLTLAVAGYKGVQSWSPGANASQIARLEVDTASIKLAWSDDGRYLATGNLDRTLTIRDEQHPDDPWILQGCPGKIHHLHWLEGTTSPCLAVAGGTALLLWDLSPDTTAWSGRFGEGHQSTITALTTHPQLAVPTSGDNDGYVCLWSVAGEIEQIFRNNVSGITTLDWHGCGQQLAIGHLSGEIAIMGGGISINTDDEAKLV